MWRPTMEYARMSGWTVQEKIFHTFFRTPNITYHAYAQALHPFSYLERQRGDAFIRRVETLMPGIEAPDWAQAHRRAVPDFDWEGMLNPGLAINTVLKESTPKPHHNTPAYGNLNNVLNNRGNIGGVASRLFYNEVVRGDFMKGYYSENDLQAMDSWYAGGRNNEMLKAKKDDKEKAAIRKAQIEKWVNNINQYFPEFRNYKPTPQAYKFDEPYYDRNVADVRLAMLRGLWAQSLMKNTFSNAEIQHILEFHLNEKDDVFFVVDQNDGLTKPTELYLKFSKHMQMPNIFDSLERFTAKIPEHQFAEAIDRSLGINFNVVEQFRVRHVNYLNELKQLEGKVNYDELKAIRNLISEEIYNPIFSQALGKNEDRKSKVVAAVLANNNAYDTISKLENTLNDSKGEVHFLSKQVFQNLSGRIRNVVKTFPFKYQNAAKA